MSINRINQLGIQVKRESNYIVIGNYCYDMYITKDKLYLNGMRYFNDFATYWSKQEDVYGPLSGLKKLLVDSEIEVGNELNWDLAKDILGTATENKKNTVTYIGKDKNDYTGCGAPDYAPASDASEDEKEQWKTICKEKEESDRKQKERETKVLLWRFKNNFNDVCVPLHNVTFKETSSQTVVTVNGKTFIFSKDITIDDVYLFIDLCTEIEMSLPIGDVREYIKICIFKDFSNLWSEEEMEKVNGISDEDYRNIVLGYAEELEELLHINNARKKHYPSFTEVTFPGDGRTYRFHRDVSWRDIDEHAFMCKFLNAHYYAHYIHISYLFSVTVFRGSQFHSDLYNEVHFNKVAVYVDGIMEKLPKMKEEFEKALEARKCVRKHREDGEYTYIKKPDGRCWGFETRLMRHDFGRDDEEMLEYIGIPISSIDVPFWYWRSACVHEDKRYLKGEINNMKDSIPEINKFVNCTQHPLKYKNDKSEIITLKPSGNIARLEETEEQITEYLGVPMVAKKYSEILDLPAPEEGTMYVVSGLIKQQNDISQNPRTDLIVPNSGKTAVRTEKGFVDYVVSFIYK